MSKVKEGELGFRTFVMITIGGAGICSLVAQAFGSRDFLTPQGLKSALDSHATGIIGSAKIWVAKEEGEGKDRTGVARPARLEPGSDYLPPNPAACMEFLDMSLVDEMPCMRNLKSSALDAFSSAVS